MLLIFQIVKPVFKLMHEMVVLYVVLSVKAFLSSRNPRIPELFNSVILNFIETPSARLGAGGARTEINE
jgi:hypothetical protein